MLHYGRMRSSFRILVRPQADVLLDLAVAGLVRAKMRRTVLPVEVAESYSQPA
jgi:hypothetical protein